MESTKQDDVAKLAAGLRELAPLIKKSARPEWSREPALKVIDCVLSLNRNYKKFVEPRLEERAFPRTRTVSELRKQILHAASPSQFVASALHYRDETRAKTLWDVVEWLVRDVCHDGPPAKQLLLLEKWASGSSWNASSTPRIHGFGLAGFQYLRMLFGANTTKPDVWIRTFVKEKIGRKVSDREALQFLERTAPKVGISSLRDMDTTIWERLNRRCGSRATSMPHHETALSHVTVQRAGRAISSAPPSSSRGCAGGETS
jgi:hypothetical protein